MVYAAIVLVEWNCSESSRCVRMQSVYFLMYSLMLLSNLNAKYTSIMTILSIAHVWEWMASVVCLPVVKHAISAIPPASFIVDGVNRTTGSALSILSVPPVRNVVHHTLRDYPVPWLYAVLHYIHHARGVSNYTHTPYPIPHLFSWLRFYMSL